jgi:hypothetical protein
MDGGMSVLLVVGRRPLVGALDIEIWSRAHELSRLARVHHMRGVPADINCGDLSGE